MITKFNNFKLITENPDTVHLNDLDDITYHCTDPDAVPFYIEPNNDHTQVKEIFVGDNGIYHDEYDNFNKKANDRQYSGRLWLNARIITFWVYPNVKLFKSIIEHLEDELNIKMFNNKWEIEVIKEETGEVRKTNFKIKFEIFQSSCCSWISFFCTIYAAYIRTTSRSY